MSFVLLAAAAVALAVWFFLRRQAEMQPGTVLYRDSPGAPTLVSRRYELSGRPDYVVRGEAGLVPVEVKSRTCGQRGPYPGERAQALAYCLLAEEAFGMPVAWAELHYDDQQIRVRFGEGERREILRLLAQMAAERDAHRSHQQAGKCRGCGFRSRCTEALV